MTRINLLYKQSGSVTTSTDNSQVERDVSQARGPIDIYCKCTTATNPGTLNINIYGSVSDEADLTYQEVTEITGAQNIAAIGLYYIGTVTKLYQYMRASWTVAGAGAAFTFDLTFVFDT